MRPDEPIPMAVPKTLLTEYEINNRLLSCERFWTPLALKTKNLVGGNILTANQILPLMKTTKHQVKVKINLKTGGIKNLVTFCWGHIDIWKAVSSS